MGASWKIATIFGIPIKIHWTFGFLLLLIGFSGRMGGLSWSLIFWQMIFVLALFLCVILHEYGHALTARKFRVRTRDIIISPIGGIARLERLPEKPIQEFLIAIAGPAMNILIAFVILPYFLFDNWHEISSVIRRLRVGNLLIDSSNFLPAIFILNILLAGFNLLPAFPMDGGRVLRSLLAIRLNRVTATQFAARLGQILAAGLLLYSFYNSSFILSIIAVFVFITAAQELRMVKLDAMLNSYTVGDLLRTDFSRLYLPDPMRIPFEKIKTSLEKNFLVFDDQEQPRGILTSTKIVEALKLKHEEAPVVEYLQALPPFVQPNQGLKETYYFMNDNKVPILGVTVEGVLIGVIELEQLNQFVDLQQKTKSKLFSRS